MNEYEFKLIFENLRKTIPNLTEYYTAAKVRELVSDNDGLLSMSPSEQAEFFMEQVWDDPMRRCTHCGRLMKEGYLLGNDYACSDECRNALYKEWYGCLDDKEAEERYLEDNENNSDDTEYFYTEWE